MKEPLASQTSADLTSFFSPLWSGLSFSLSEDPCMENSWMTLHIEANIQQCTSNVSQTEFILCGEWVWEVVTKEWDNVAYGQTCVDLPKNTSPGFKWTKTGTQNRHHAVPKKVSDNLVAKEKGQPLSAGFRTWSATRQWWSSECVLAQGTMTLLCRLLPSRKNGEQKEQKEAA